MLLSSSAVREGKEWPSLLAESRAEAFEVHEHHFLNWISQCRWVDEEVVPRLSMVGFHGIYKM